MAAWQPVQEFFGNPSYHSYRSGRKRKKMPHKISEIWYALPLLLRGVISDLIVQGGFTCIVLSLRSIRQHGYAVAVSFFGTKPSEQKDGLESWVSSLSHWPVLFQRRATGVVWSLPAWMQSLLSQSAASPRQVCLQVVKNHARRSSLKTCHGAHSFSSKASCQRLPLKNWLGKIGCSCGLGL